MKKKITVKRIWIMAAVLMYLNLLGFCGLGRTYAEYTTQVMASDAARAAVWDVKITGTSLVQEEIVAGLSSYSSSEYSSYGITESAPDSHGYGTDGYRFTVVTGEATDTTGTLSVQVSVSKDGTEGWPEGLSAALYSVSGETGSESYEFLSENTNGSFADVKAVMPGTAFTGEYLVCFKSTGACVAGGYEVTVSASMDQVD